jgi:hypothetical protein
MSNKEHLIEQHILAYESRMRHIDELYERAHKAASDKGEGSEAHAHLNDIAEHHSRLPGNADEIRTMPLDHWREDTIREAGPMAIWDIVAQKLEDFLERHE